jgi:hypothetical protein
MSNHVTISAWNPVVTPTTIGDDTRYEYSPSIVTESPGVQRVWCTAGRNTDTISSVLTNGTDKDFWVLPGKLVADPCVLRYGTQYKSGWYLVTYTVGDPDGKRNGIGWHWQKVSGKQRSQHRMLIEQTAGSTANAYGLGQPALAARPGSPTIMLHTDTRSGVNRIGAHMLHVSNAGGTVALGDPIEITDNDGASVEAWWVSQTRLGLVMSNGSNMVATRTYQLVNGRLIRETGETQRNGFYGRTFTQVDNAIDGAGIVRDAANQPIRTPAGELRTWIATGNKANPATWQLRASTLAYPES